MNEKKIPDESPMAQAPRPDAPQAEWALFFARLGLEVFPAAWVANGACACRAGTACESPGKHPLVKWSTEATRDQSKIAAWWARWPLANVAIATGARSGLVVIDCDRKPGVDGLKSLAKILRVPPTTKVIHTGSGGVHFYYRHPGWGVPCSAGVLGPGIDVRGDGGYVIAPPSTHISGGHYVW